VVGVDNVARQCAICRQHGADRTDSAQHPSFVRPGIPHTNDPTSSATIAYNAGLAGISFVEFDTAMRFRRHR